MQDIIDRFLDQFLDQFQASPEFTILGVIAVGVLLTVLGVSNAFAGPTAEVRRLQGGTSNRKISADYDLVRGDDNDTYGLLRAFVPTSQKDRSRIRAQMRQAGIQRRNAVTTFYLVRAVLALGLPSLYLGALQLPPAIQSQLRLTDYLSGQSMVTIFYVVTVLALLGYYLPQLWLKRKTAARQQRIWESFPAALDLLQISVESGLGFDAAIVRVGHELSGAAPDIAAEFMMLQLEIQAGKEKQRAYLEMAERTGVEEVTSFANVILQASQYGSSISKALNTYADEMRLARELRAQEKANRLPVQMSGVIALTMMPALLIICLMPMLIRWMRMFG